jgi:hypothetical protein
MLKRRKLWDVGVPTYGWSDLPEYEPAVFDIKYRWLNNSAETRLLFWEWQNQDENLKLFQICKIEHADNLPKINWCARDRNDLVLVDNVPVFRFQNLEIAILFKLAAPP